MACARRDGEADGEPDRSLRHMLRAIAEERSRAGLRHDISGLGESGGAGGQRRSPRRERQPRPGSLSVTTTPAPVVFRGPAPSPGAPQAPAPLSEMPLGENGQAAPRTSRPAGVFEV